MYPNALPSDVEANTGGLGGQEFRQPKKFSDSPCFLSVVAS
ncbi:hypothetical protein MC7420_3426 [Coleofasciculus chthonoplastes PCC 7420]|uniref:Uncharacterized protein n=1 Tax=Coleofasciculus chthonoplastes PCC 7420 TaxID=118168 RepID=B4W3G3_9CYAN|nr:hypothetical protein MC7420_3426 [Coleofasciculus chthonoplastes PCC 7420]